MELLHIPYEQIIVEDRGRNDFGDIPELALSIKQFGVINPILVERVGENSYKLIAGERRFRACRSLGWKEIPATTRESLTGLERKLIELEENVRRLSLHWTEETLLKDQIDELKRQQFGSAVQGGNKHQLQETWGLAQTAALLGESAGNVSKDLKLAKMMKENPQLIAELAKYPKTVAFSKLVHMKKAEDAKAAMPNAVIDIDLRLGDCTDCILSLPDSSVNLIITDPPFAVDKINDAKGNYSDVMGDSDNSDEITMIQCMDRLIPQLYRVLKEGGHFYMFYGPEWYCKPSVVSWRA